MLNIAYSCFVYLVAATINYIFFYGTYEVRGRITTSIFFGLVLFELGSIINISFGNTIWINFIFMFIVHMAFSLTCFKINFSTAALYSVVLLIASTALEFATIFIVSALSHRATTDYNSDIYLLTIMAIICKSLYFIFCIILMRFIRNKPIRKKYPPSFYLYPIMVFICLTIFWYICVNEKTNEFTKGLLAAISGMLFFSTIFLFVVYHRNLEKEHEYLNLKNEYYRLQTEKSYYDILEHQNQQLMIYAHDARNHLAAIQSLNTDPNIENYILKLSEQLRTYTNNCQSGNMILDVIINKYVTECDMREINFQYDVRIYNLGNIDSIDTVAILGNLLDNAVSAAEKSAAKSVSIETSTRNNYGVVIISNSCDTPPKSNGRELITTKDEPKFHGLGVKSVLKTLKKYGGDMSWEYNGINKVFITTVMIKL